MSGFFRCWTPLGAAPRGGAYEDKTVSERQTYIGLVPPDRSLRSRRVNSNVILHLVFPVGGTEMIHQKKTLRTCPKGHEYYKTSNYPTCPKCAADNKQTLGFSSELFGPARSALEHEGITTLAKLSKCTDGQILALHGVGPKSLPTLSKALESEGRSFN